MAPIEPHQQHGVVVPVKRTDIAKSRLSPLGDEVRRGLGVAFAKDTVAAALATPGVALVLVVTDDHLLAASLAELGAQVVPDAVTDDLNGSLVQAATEVERRAAGVWPVAVCADLPALRPAELAAALRGASCAGPSFVADAEGEGTTAYVAPTPAQFAPRFGAGSRAEHLAADARELLLTDVPSLRRDVDTPSDLSAAARLGLGPHTASVVAGLRL